MSSQHPASGDGDDRITLEQLVNIVGEDERLQKVPAASWQFPDATAFLDVHPSNTVAPYWRAGLRDDLGKADRDDVIKFVATRLYRVDREGFPPVDFAEIDDGWFRITASVDLSVDDFMPGDL